MSAGSDDPWGYSAYTRLASSVAALATPMSPVPRQYGTCSSHARLSRGSNCAPPTLYDEASARRFYFTSTSEEKLIIGGQPRPRSSVSHAAGTLTYACSCWVICTVSRHEAIGLVITHGASSCEEIDYT